MNGPANLIGPAALSASDWGALVLLAVCLLAVCLLAVCLLAWRRKVVVQRRRTRGHMTVFGEIHLRALRQRTRLFGIQHANSCATMSRLHRLEAARERLRRCGYFKREP